MLVLDETHDPAVTSWVQSANGHDEFPIQNLPFGIFSRNGEPPRGGVAIGDVILDLSALADSELVEGVVAIAIHGAATPRLNAFLAMGSGPRRAVRKWIFDALRSGSVLEEAIRPLLRKSDECSLHVPVTIGDYTDFYTGIHHAENVGRLLRPDAPLLPNYKHVPIGYHGRTSSIRFQAPLCAVRLARSELTATRRLYLGLPAGWIMSWNLEYGSGPATCWGVRFPLRRLQRA